MASTKKLRQPRKPVAPLANRGGNRHSASGDETEGPNPTLSFPVVAVGASAGGLGSFTALLKALPSKCGVALVLIQHLEPKHESALASLLSKVTSMAVVEVADGVKVEPNHVYVIPPNKNMTIRKGALRLGPRSEVRGIQRPIDDFAVALAEEQGNASIGVILSGTGSDGTQGLKAIKAAGGITFAQDPKGSQFAAMPMSAITAGAVDFVLPPKGIASELARISRHPYVVKSQPLPDGDDLEKICTILRSATGIDFKLYKQATFRRRVARRMALQKVASLYKYGQILKQNSDEAHALADDIFIHVTSFFRNPECFQALRKRVMSKWRHRKPNEEPLRIWAPGCSTGEEVYSLAMLLLEELGEQANRIKIQIFGTDIQERSAEHARAGIYTEPAIAGVSPARLKRFFIKTEHGYQIQTFVRDLCVFARHDLAKDPPFSRLDLVSCRNVLIYMGQALQKRVLATFQYALKPGGSLFLGNSETIASYSDIFTSDERKYRIFSRNPTNISFRDFEPAATQPRAKTFEPERSAAGNGTFDFHKEAESLLLEHYVPPALIVDADLRIVHFQGDTSRYLAPATGQPSFHLLKMVRPELVVDLRTAISKVRKEGVGVRKEASQFTYKGRPANVRLDILPFKKRNGRKQHLMIVFLEVEQPAIAAGRGSAQGLRKYTAQSGEKLERELIATREHLRVLISEHETAQEEMKAANEEILSSNEELQSTNEELETAKEELQSSNEELITLNEELQHRNAELGTLTHDLNNVLIGVDIPLLVLDNDLRVRRFTPVAGALLNMIPSDVGRPFSNLASTLNVADWDALFAEVATDGRQIEKEVADRHGRRYSLRLRPYRTGENVIEGILVVILDTDAIYRARDLARAARDVAQTAEQRSDSILNSLTSNVAVLGADGTILATNVAWNRTALDSGNPPVGKIGVGANYIKACKAAAIDGLANAEAVLYGVLDVLEGRRITFQIEYLFRTTDEEGWFLLNASPLIGSTGGAVIAHLDITDRKRAEVAAQRSESTLRALLESSPQSVLAVTEDETIVFANGNTEKMFGYSREELLSKPLSMLLPQESREIQASQHETYFGHIEGRARGIGMALKGRRKNGSVFPVEVGLGIVDGVGRKMAVAFVSDITQRRLLELADQAHAKEVQALAASLLTAQEEERRRVSRELHDQVCQQLAALAFDIGGLAADPPPAKHARGRLKELQKRVVKASEEAHHLAYELHPSVLDDLGLVVSLRGLCGEFSRRINVAIEFDANVIAAPIPRAVTSSFYRVAQESLQNIAKHAGPKKVVLALTARDGTLKLTISDDGVGFDPGTVQGRGGLGLIGMEERARLINGKLSINSRPGHGTVITIEVALAP